MKDTAISVRYDIKRGWRGKCASAPETIVQAIRKYSREPERVIFKFGPLPVYFYHSVLSERLPVICVGARHTKGALDMAANNTGAKDPDVLAHLAEVCFHREVTVKGFVSKLTRALVAARTKLVRIQPELSIQIRGLMKTFGLVSPAGKGSTFEKNGPCRLNENHELATIIRSLLEAWCSVRLYVAELSRRLINNARQSEACQLLMSIPGVGVVTASAPPTAEEDPVNFRSSRSIGAWLGLT